MVSNCTVLLPTACKSCESLKLSVSSLEKEIYQKQAMLIIVNSLINVKAKLGQFDPFVSSSQMDNTRSIISKQHSRKSSTLLSGIKSDSSKSISADGHVNISYWMSLFTDKEFTPQALTVLCDEFGNIDLDDFDLENKCSVLLSSHIADIEYQNYYLRRMVLELEHACEKQAQTIHNFLASPDENSVIPHSFSLFGNRAQLRWFLSNARPTTKLKEDPFSNLDLPIHNSKKLVSNRGLWGTVDVNSILV